MKLLIVDDSIIIRSRIAKIMGEPRIANVLTIVGMAANGAEALRVFRATQPDIVTMDLSMPEVDGVLLTEKMMDIDPKVHILVVSGPSSKSQALLALEKGARSFVFKPFTDDELIDALLGTVN